MQRAYSLLGSAVVILLAACSGKSDKGTLIGGGGSGNGNGDGSGGTPSGGGSSGFSAGGMGGPYFELGDAGTCAPTTCASLGWACGYTVDMCGNVVDCAAEGLTCGADQICVGGIDGPTECVAAPGEGNCELCGAVPTCAADQPTRLSGRVITPGRDDANTANQVGVPNALVYIMRTSSIDDLPAIPTGVPADGLSCDRCEDQDVGPLLAGAVTDASGNFTIEGKVPVGQEFLLVVKAGKFRRAVAYTLAADRACQTTPLPTSLSSDPEVEDNPTRLPRDLADGLAVHIPRIAISTGRIDAMECVFEKMGIAATEFGNGGSDATVQLYRGGPSGTPEGAKLNAQTPHDGELYGSLARLESYDMIVSDCEGTAWDAVCDENGENCTYDERDAHGAKLREYVNRGGRMFASHLSYTWLHENGTTAYSPDTPIETGLGPAATWDTNLLRAGNLDLNGTGVVSVVGSRPLASPRIQNFADWLEREAVTSESEGYEFAITDPRSMTDELGSASEEFVFRDGGNGRVQQFSFDTPYGAPDEASCGRVAYSGFHVAATGGGSQPFINSTFPAHCRDLSDSPSVNEGDLTDQEKVLLYMLFDLGACVGDEPVTPPCVPIECNGDGVQRCGFTPNGCGEVLDCGPCRPPA